MYLPNIPESLDADDVVAALRSLGIPDDERLVEAKFTPGSVELKFLRTASEGKDADALIGNTAPSVSGSRLSYVTTTVGVRRKRDGDQ